MACRRTTRIALALLSFAMLSSCATQQYAYVPAGVSGQKTSHVHKGKAYYQVPPEAPTGNVRVMSAGVVKLKPSEGGPKIPALHLRIVISNQSSPVPWTVDPRNLRISFPNGGSQVPPTFVQSRSETTPTLIVAQGEMRTLDLYYALPDNERSSKELPEFDFRWQFQAGPTLVQETTSFDRVSIDDYGYGAYPDYWGPYGWYGDWWGMGWGPGWWGGSPLVGGMAGAPPSRPVIVGH